MRRGNYSAKKKWYQKKRGWIVIAAIILVFAGINGIKNTNTDKSDKNKVSQVAKDKSNSKKSTKEVSSEKIENTEKSAEPQKPVVPTEYKSALRKAESYADNMHMSKLGIQKQLTSEYGEKFSTEAAQYAMENIKADWNKNALFKAKSYQEDMSMSPESIRDQ